MSLLSTIGAGLTGFLTGGPAGAVAGVVGSFVGGSGSRPGTAVATLPSLPTFGSPASPSGGGGGFLQGLNQQANSWLQNQGIAPAAGSCPRGYHLNKHALPASKKHGAVGPRMICVRNRSMNPLNPRALTKALKREKRAKKLLARLHVFRGAASGVRRLTRTAGHKAGCGCVVCARR